MRGLEGLSSVEPAEASRPQQAAHGEAELTVNLRIGPTPIRRPASQDVARHEGVLPQRNAPASGKQAGGWGRLRPYRMHAGCTQAIVTPFAKRCRPGKRASLGIRQRQVESSECRGSRKP